MMVTRCGVLFQQVLYDEDVRVAKYLYFYDLIVNAERNLICFRTE